MTSGFNLKRTYFYLLLKNSWLIVHSEVYHTDVVNRHTGGSGGIDGVLELAMCVTRGIAINMSLGLTVRLFFRFLKISKW